MAGDKGKMAVNFSKNYWKKSSVSVLFCVVGMCICEDTYIRDGSKSSSQYESESDFRGEELGWRVGDGGDRGEGMGG